jgi:hypothetical protein
MSAIVLVLSKLVRLQFSVIIKSWVFTCDKCKPVAIRVDGYCGAPSAQSTSPAITMLRSPNLRETMLQNRPLGSEASETVHASSKQRLCG